MLGEAFGKANILMKEKQAIGQTYLINNITRH